MEALEYAVSPPGQFPFPQGSAGDESLVMSLVSQLQMKNWFLSYSYS